MGFSSVLVWAGLGVLAAVAWYSVRARLRRSLRTRAVEVDDEAIAQILEDGVLATDEDDPLDLEHIREEEENFWKKPWDEAEEL
ncbi:MAG: hypothetical protein BMS9Abin29_1674 [Gemmatimonadota bacterium]|nr:MAG: hypothetical protein BMS9Abin29_1674 [Gemmatimonadota bacterium]